MLLLPVICLLPRYIAKATKILYNPSDIEILRAARKYNPDLDVWNHPLLGGRGHGSGLPEEKDEVGDMNQFPPRPSFQSRRSLGSRTDMATGLSEVHRGFDFSTEEDGVSMRRIQSNLSGKHASRTSVNAAGLKKNNSSSLFPSLRRSMRKRPKYSPENTSVPS
jgi:phospholipid-translocating ATPase